MTEQKSEQTETATRVQEQEKWTDHIWFDESCVYCKARYEILKKQQLNIKKQKLGELRLFELRPDWNSNGYLHYHLEAKKPDAKTLARWKNHLKIILELDVSEKENEAKTIRQQIAKVSE